MTATYTDATDTPRIAILVAQYKVVLACNGQRFGWDLQANDHPYDVAHKALKAMVSFHYDEELATAIMNTIHDWMPETVAHWRDMVADISEEE